MTTFVYRTAPQNGAARNGVRTIDAPDRATAIRELIRRGESPVALEESRAGVGPAAAARGGGGFTFSAVMSRGEMANFVRELATAIQAGLPLVQSLKTIARQGRSPRQREMMQHLIGEVEHGKSLGEAMVSWGKPFGELIINMTRSGEVSGRLPEVLMQAADLMDRDVKLRRSILGATLYPMILAALVVAAIIVVVTFIVPKLLEQFAGQSARLPWPTQVVKGTADFFSSYWWVILPAVGLSVLMGMRYYATPEGRLNVDTRLLRVPVLGRLLRDVAVARFTRTLGTLTSAGIPVLSALRVTRGTLGNRAMERVIDEVADRVAGGRTISEVMERSGYFPPMLVQIVNLGERSGRLDELLSQAAHAFEERTEMSLKLFTTALPPLLVVVLAGVVGFVVLAIMLALLEFQNSVGAAV